MILTNARLTNFRNHEDTQFEFASAMNVFLGDNGMGKTNILEAISFLCLTKSFYAGTDTISLQKEKNFFEVSGEFLAENNHNSRVRVAYDETAREKKFFINNGEIEKFSSVIGQFPVVILSPENNTITFGAPSERRKFADLIISQSSKIYAEDMLEFKRVLRQRNKILSEADGKPKDALLEPWTEMLASFGAKITAKRIQFTQEFIPYIEQTYAQIADNTEIPKMEYAPGIEIDEAMRVDAIRQILLKKLHRKKNDEYRLRSSLAGPHKDEFVFSLNGLHLKQYASQGQHKTFLIALKVAEFFYLKERCNENPVFLLDDVFSELDEERSAKLLQLVEKIGQTFITTTSEKIFNNSIVWNNERRKFIIRGGAVVREALAA